MSAMHPASYQVSAIGDDGYLIHYTEFLSCTVKLDKVSTVPRGPAKYKNSTASIHSTDRDA